VWPEKFKLILNYSHLEDEQSAFFCDNDQLIEKKEEKILTF